MQETFPKSCHEMEVVTDLFLHFPNETNHQKKNGDLVLSFVGGRSE